MAGRVLYVDDEFDLPARTSAVLRSVDLELVHLDDSEQALRAVDEAPPALLLVEVLMSGCDGFRLVEEAAAAARGRDLPIVIVTRGDRSPELYGRALECGVRDFLCKPLLEAQVLEAALAYGAPAGTNATGHESSVREGEAWSSELALEPLPAVLARLHRTAASGTLTLAEGTETCVVQIRNGSPVALRGTKPREPFEEFAQRAGWIKPEQYEQAIDQVVLGNGDLRSVLVGMGALTGEQLERVEAEWARDWFLDLFRWASGRCEFVPGGRMSEAGAHELQCDPVGTLLQGVLERLPEDVLQSELTTAGHLYPVLSERFDQWVERLGLSAASVESVTAMAGDRTLAEEIAAGELDPRLFYALTVLKAVALRDEPELRLVDLVEAASTQAEAPGAANDAPASAASWLHDLSDRVAEQDDYALFGITHDSSDAEVQGAYRALLASFPNLPPELDDLARGVRARIDQAYGRVKDEDTRAAFAALRGGRPAEEGPLESTEGADRAVDAEEHFRKGRERLEARDPEGAMESLGMAMHLDPDQGDYVAHLGYALFLSNPGSDVIRREALEHIAKGVKLAPDRATPLLFLGRVFRRSGDVAMAEKVLRRALKIAPDHPAVLQELCLMQLDEPGREKQGWLRRLGGAVRRGR